MRRDGNWKEAHSPRADKGSKRQLWNEQSLAEAIDYVLNEQGEDLPELEGLTHPLTRVVLTSLPHDSL